MTGRSAPQQLTRGLNRLQSLPRTDRIPVLLALPMKFSAKQVYLPSSDRLMFLIIRVPSKVTVTLQQGQKRPSQPKNTPWPWEGDRPSKSHLSTYLVLFPKISVPLLQSIDAFGAARGWHGMLTSPPRAAGISRLTGFCLKSGASAAGEEVLSHSAL